MRIAVYQPEIPQNLGTLLRTSACLGFGVDIIEPCGFPLSDRRLKRSGMDYIDQVSYEIHGSYQRFLDKREPGRLILLSTKSSVPYDSFPYLPTDCLMVGREADGVPVDVENGIVDRIVIPMRPECRSLNVAIAAGIVMGEMARQLRCSN